MTPRKTPAPPRDRRPLSPISRRSPLAPDLAPTLAPALALALALTAAARPSPAQVNVERLRKRMDGDGVAGQLDASLVGRTGNTESMVGGGAAHLRVHEGPHMGLLALRGDYARNNGSLDVENAFAHLRYNYLLVGSLWGEVFAQVQGDAVRRLRFRSLVGTGPRYGLFESRELDVYLGTAYMLEREELNVEPGAPDAPLTVAHRSSSYLSASFSLGPTLSLTTASYFQPRFDAPRDFRVLSETALSIELTRRIGARIECSIRHDSRPPTGVLPTDVVLRNALTLTL